MVEPRQRKVRILATLGPASDTPAMIRSLFDAGADAFRVNMSHGSPEARLALIEAVRSVEREVGRPIAVLADLQGPKLRVGKFAGGKIMLDTGQRYRFDSDPAPGNATRALLPHREIFRSIRPGQRLLLDDGKVQVRVAHVEADAIEVTVEVGGPLSDNKGLNVPDTVLPVAALTEKDRRDLAMALEAQVDWIGLSFVQRPEDVAEARRLIGGRAALLAKIEKPAALDRLPEIVELADAVMVARGDLGVELPPEQVPPAQKRIVQAARRAGKPVVVATQMLESMIASPSPTRAEVSDVANAMYDGADAVMLSAESAAGRYPCEAVAMMDAIARQVEADPSHDDRIHFTQVLPETTTADALSLAAEQIGRTVSAKAVVCFTTSGSTARRASRERMPVPILVLTPSLETARRMALVWGVHAVRTRDVASFEEMIDKSKRMALRTGLAGAGDRLVVMAGVPFGTPGSTNVLHVTRLVGDELKRHRRA